MSRLSSVDVVVVDGVVLVLCLDVSLSGEAAEVAVSGREVSLVEEVVSAIFG